MKLKQLDEMISQTVKSVLSEGNVEKLANAVRYANKNSDSWASNYGIDKSITSGLKVAGITSQDIFQFAALFPRNSFKVNDIIDGDLANRIKQLYLDDNVVKEKLKKVEALKNFMVAMNKAVGGDVKDWLNAY